MRSRNFCGDSLNEPVTLPSTCVEIDVITCWLAPRSRRTSLTSLRSATYSNFCDCQGMGAAQTVPAVHSSSAAAMPFNRPGKVRTPAFGPVARIRCMMLSRRWEGADRRCLRRIRRGGGPLGEAQRQMVSEGASLNCLR